MKLNILLIIVIITLHYSCCVFSQQFADFVGSFYGHCEFQVLQGVGYSVALNKCIQNIGYFEQSPWTIPTQSFNQSYSLNYDSTTQVLTMETFQNKGDSSSPCSSDDQITSNTFDINPVSCYPTPLFQPDSSNYYSKVSIDNEPTYFHSMNYESTLVFEQYELSSNSNCNTDTFLYASSFTGAYNQTLPSESTSYFYFCDNNNDPSLTICDPHKSCQTQTISQKCEPNKNQMIYCIPQ